MLPKIGRNDLCPCGSGLKYKRCCLAKVSPRAEVLGSSQQFRFEAGSYGSAGAFVPSVACLKRGGDDENYHYMLVRPEKPCEGEDQASKVAHQDLDSAAAERDRVGTAAAFATSLREAGYVRLDDFHIAASDDGPPNTVRHGGDNLEALQRVWYRRGFTEILADRTSLHTSEFGAEDLLEDIAAGIRDNDLLDAGGVYGDPLVGEPVQIDELVLELEGRQIEITVYNRAIMLFQTNEDIYPRVHRVCCLIDRVDPPPDVQGRAMD